MANKNKLNETLNDIPEKTRQSVIDILDSILIDSVDLGLQAKQAHWNVKGIHFLPLHELFDKVYQEAGEFTDLVAERMVQLGGSPTGAASVVAKSSRLKPYPLLVADGTSHAKAIAEALATFGKHTRAGIDSTDKLGDVDSSDLLTEVSRAVDKTLWFVEAHIAKV